MDIVSARTPHSLESAQDICIQKRAQSLYDKLQVPCTL
jgi:hypothetical protein